MKRSAHALFRVQNAVILIGLLIGLAFLVSSSSFLDTAFGGLLGIGNVATVPLPRTLSIAITPSAPIFNPPAAAIMHDGTVTFRNDLDTPIVVRSTAPSPTQFSVTIAAHARATVRLSRTGLYHYYDAATASPLSTIPPVTAATDTTVQDDASVSETDQGEYGTAKKPAQGVETDQNEYGTISPRSGETTNEYGTSSTEYGTTKKEAQGSEASTNEYGRTKTAAQGSETEQNEYEGTSPQSDATTDEYGSRSTEYGTADKSNEYGSSSNDSGTADKANEYGTADKSNESGTANKASSGSKTEQNEYGAPSPQSDATTNEYGTTKKPAPSSEAAMNMGDMNMGAMKAMTNALPLPLSDVLTPKHGTTSVRQGWIVVLDTLPGLQQKLVIPAGYSIFVPHVVVAVAGSTLVVANQDTVAHNVVVDSASPIGGAFIVEGTSTEQGKGWQRSLVLQQPGLYHVYCTMHAVVAGRVSGWASVVALPPARVDPYNPNDPMEAWIVVLPATTT